MWLWLGHSYGRVLMWCVEALAGWLQGGRDLLLPVPGQAVGASILATIALFAATPSTGVGWRLVWGVGTATLMAGLQVALLTAQVMYATTLAHSQAVAPRSFLTGELVSTVAPDRFVDAWPWVGPLVTVLLWFLATGRAQRAVYASNLGAIDTSGVCNRTQDA